MKTVKILCLAGLALGACAAIGGKTTKPAPAKGRILKMEAPDAGSTIPGKDPASN